MRARGPARPALALTLAAVVALVAGLLAAVPPAQASYRGRNGVIAFVSDRDGDKNIYTVDPDTLALERLTDDPAEDLSPAWSPGGDRIAFASNRSGRYEIWVMNADGFGLARLTSGPQEQAMPTWSPDGDRIAYAVMPALGAAPDLWVMGADGSDPHALVTGTDWDYDPAWSPDGDRIAYTHVRLGMPPLSTVDLVSPDGGPVTTLTNPSMVAGSPGWGPGGIVYVRLPIPVDPPELRVVQATGMHDMPLVTFAPGTEVDHPTWSPDGSLVAYQADAGTSADIYVTPFGGGLAAPLVTDAAEDTDPDWQTVLDPAVRLAGPDRIDTALVVSGARYGPGDAGGVVLARSDLFPDALAGTPLALAIGGPILLTPPDALDPRTEAELHRVLPAGDTVHLLGGAEALSPAVEDAVAAAGFTTERHGGETRYDTAGIVALATADRAGDPAVIIEATGTRFPEALAGGSAAARMGGVLVLTNDETLPDRTLYVLDAFPGARRIALGPEAAAADPGAQAVVGTDPVDTVRLLATDPDLDSDRVALATSERFPDALAGGLFAADAGAVLLLADPTGITPDVDTYLRDRRDTIEGAYVFGGTLAVPERVVMQVRRAITGV